MQFSVLLSAVDGGARLEAERGVKSCRVRGVWPSESPACPWRTSVCPRGVAPYERPGYAAWKVRCTSAISCCSTCHMRDALMEAVRLLCGPLLVTPLCSHRLLLQHLQRALGRLREGGERARLRRLAARARLACRRGEKETEQTEGEQQGRGRGVESGDRPPMPEPSSCCSRCSQPLQSLHACHKEVALGEKKRREEKRREEKSCTPASPRPARPPPGCPPCAPRAPAR